MFVVECCTNWEGCYIIATTNSSIFAKIIKDEFKKAYMFSKSIQTVRIRKFKDGWIDGSLLYELDKENKNEKM